MDDERYVGLIQWIAPFSKNKVLLRSALCYWSTDQDNILSSGLRLNKTKGCSKLTGCFSSSLVRRVTWTKPSFSVLSLSCKKSTYTLHRPDVCLWNNANTCMQLRRVTATRKHFCCVCMCKGENTWMLETDAGTTHLWVQACV